MIVTDLLCQNDHEAPEDGDDVDEQIDAVPDEVVVSSAALLYDQLGVVQDASAHHCQSKVQLRLEGCTNGNKNIGLVTLAYVFQHTDYIADSFSFERVLPNTEVSIPRRC